MVFQTGRQSPLACYVGDVAGGAWACWYLSLHPLYRRYKSKIYIFYIISDKFNKIYLINNIVSRNKMIIIRNIQSFIHWETDLAHINHRSVHTAEQQLDVG